MRPCVVSVVSFNSLLKISIYRTPPRIPEVHLPEEPFLQVASALRIEINQGFAVLRNIASGRDLKKFLIVCIILLPCLFGKSCTLYVSFPLNLALLLV